MRVKHPFGKLQQYLCTEVFPYAVFWYAYLWFGIKHYNLAIYLKVWNSFFTVSLVSRVYIYTVKYDGGDDDDNNKLNVDWRFRHM